MIVVPPELSCSPEKRELYAVDPYFRDAWEDCITRWEYRAVAARLFPLAPVVFRPDAFLVRGVRRGLSALYERGFTPVAYCPFRWSRWIVREVWRFQLNINTRDRLDVMDMILPAADSLYVLFRGPFGDTPLPATTRLSNEKGPSLPRLRQPQHLRSLIGATQVSALTYLHIPDEPADIIRELGIFFDQADRTKFLHAIDGSSDDVKGKINAAFAQMYDAVPSHSLDCMEALDRISAHVHEARRLRASIAFSEAEDLDQLLALCESVGRGGRDWRQLFALADTHGVPIDHWDRVAIASARHDRHLDGLPILPDVRISDWEVTRSVSM